MNIVEWRFDLEKNMDDLKRDSIYDHIKLTPGILNSKFVQNEGYLSITLDADLCSRDEILEIMKTDLDQQLNPENLVFDIKMNNLFKRLFRR